MYTGHETKAQLNTSSVVFKNSRLEKTLNKMIAFLLVVEIILSVISAMIGGFWKRSTGIGSWYLGDAETSAFAILLVLFRVLSLTKTLIFEILKQAILQNAVTRISMKNLDKFDLFFQIKLGL